MQSTRASSPVRVEIQGGFSYVGLGEGEDLVAET